MWGFRQGSEDLWFIKLTLMLAGWRGERPGDPSGGRAVDQGGKAGREGWEEEANSGCRVASLGDWPSVEG